MPRTFRELVWAWEGKEYPAWERTAALLAAIHNTVPQDPKHPRRPAVPQDFFQRPGQKRIPRGTPLTPDAFRSMKHAFVKKK